MSWQASVPEFAALSDTSRKRLDTLAPIRVPEGTVLFRPGDVVQGYVIALSGRIGVHLIGANGREILLYDVVPGTSCIQSTFGILGGEEYSAEAVAEADSELILLPKAMFLDLLDSDAEFRRLVFAAFAKRMQSTMQILEQVAFLSIDTRLAGFLLSRAQDDTVKATQQDIANGIGSAREVVSRRLDALDRKGLVSHERGLVRLLDVDALRSLAERTT